MSVRHYTESDLEADLLRARRIAMLLDAEFQIGPIRFGMDAIIGLIPVVGDFAAALAGGYPLYVAQRHHLGRWLQFRIVANLALDFLIGSLPIIGDLADVAFKANLRNLALLEKAVARRAARRTTATPS